MTQLRLESHTVNMSLEGDLDLRLNPLASQVILVLNGGRKVSPRRSVYTETDASPPSAIGGSLFALFSCPRILLV